MPISEHRVQFLFNHSAREEFAERAEREFIVDVIFERAPRSFFGEAMLVNPGRERARNLRVLEAHARHIVAVLRHPPNGQRA